MNFREDLKKILDFWADNAVDYENGGIFTCLDREGKIYGRDKSVWFQGRALWTFSKACNVIEKNEKYLKVAENIYKFLPRCTDKDGRMFFTVTEEGKELQKRRYYFSETFAAIGLVEYYKATKKKEAWDLAEKYFDVAYKCYTGEIKNPPKVKNCNLKAHSPTMIMLSTAQSMRSVNKEKYEKLTEKLLNDVIDGGFFTEFGLMENVSIDGKFVDTPTGRIINPGHTLETAWFILSEGIYSKNEKALEFGKKVIDKMFPLGWDKKYGGIISFNDAKGFPPQQLEWDMKLWWPQCETMIATRLAYILFKEEKYKKMYEDTKAYCEKYFVDKEYGEWFGYLHYDNSVSTTLKGNIFKGPFHVPRMYMIMAILDDTNDFLYYLK